MPIFPLHCCCLHLKYFPTKPAYCFSFHACLTLLGYQLIMVWGACLNDPRSSVGWGCMPLADPPREGTRQSVAQKTSYDEKQGWSRVSLAQIPVTGAPSWSQAWGRCTTATAWWLDLCPCGPARLSPKRQRGTLFQWAHHLQEGPKGSRAKSFGWQLKAVTLAVWSLAAEAYSRDMERHLTEEEGAKAGTQG